MSFLRMENNAMVARRPIAQLSNDEWCAALQQQINDKKTREQQKCSRPDAVGAESPSRQHKSNPELHDEFASDEPHNGSDEARQERRASWSEQASMRPGRRNAQQMSAQEWCEALEQQIREKQAHVLQQKEAREYSNGTRRTSQSAPSAQDQVRSFTGGLQQESGVRAMTTSGSMPAGAGRKRVRMLAQEEYLKQMQEQLELKKKFEQDALECKKTLRQQHRRSLEEDDAQCSADALPSNATAVNLVASLRGIPSNNHAQENQAPDELLSPPHPEQKPSKQPFATGNQLKSGSLDKFEAKDSADAPEIANSMQPSAPVAVVDPVALAKIVDFCEELKRQNEDVKKQLVEQHSVLASLKSSLVVTPETGKMHAGAKMSPSDPVPHSASASAKKSHRVAASHSIPLQRQTSSLPKEKYPASAKQSGPQCENVVSESGSKAALVVRARPQKGESKIPFPSKVKIAVALEQVAASESAALTPTLKAQPKDDRDDQLPDKLPTPLLSSLQAPTASKAIDVDGEFVHEEDKAVKDGRESKDTEGDNSEEAALHFQIDSKDDDHDECTADSEKKNEPQRRIDEFGSDRKSLDEQEEHLILHTSARLESVNSAKPIWEDEDIPLGCGANFCTVTRNQSAMTMMTRAHLKPKAR